MALWLGMTTQNAEYRVQSLRDHYHLHLSNHLDLKKINKNQTENYYYVNTDMLTKFCYYFLKLIYSVKQTVEKEFDSWMH